MNSARAIELLSPFWRLSVGAEDRRASSSGRFWRELGGGATIAALGRWVEANAELDNAAIAIAVIDIARALRLSARVRDGCAEVGDAIWSERITHRITREGIVEL